MNKEALKALLNFFALVIGSVGISTQLTIGVFAFWYIIYQELVVTSIGGGMVITILLPCLAYMGTVFLIAIWSMSVLGCMKYTSLYPRITQLTLLLAVGMLATNYTDPELINHLFIKNFYLHTIGFFAFLTIAHGAVETLPE